MERRAGVGFRGNEDREANPDKGPDHPPGPWWRDLLRIETSARIRREIGEALLAASPSP